MVSDFCMEEIVQFRAEFDAGWTAAWKMKINPQNKAEIADDKPTIQKLRRLLGDEISNV